MAPPFARPPAFYRSAAAFARLGAVVIVHAVMLGVISHHLDAQPPRAPQTIEVALIAPPAPIPVAPPKVEAPPVPPKVVEPPPVREVEKPKPRLKPKPKPRPKPEQAITDPTPAPAPEAESAPEAPVVEPAPAPPVAVAPAPTAAAPAPVAEARFDADYLNNPDPGYPRLSKRMGEQGKVLLRVRVSARGRADEVRVHRSSGHTRLDEAARKAVAGWRFVPAKQGDEAIASWVIVPIEFKLKDS